MCSSHRIDYPLGLKIELRATMYWPLAPSVAFAARQAPLDAPRLVLSQIDAFDVRSGCKMRRTRSEHNDSAIPPKLAVKAEVANRRKWAISSHSNFSPMAVSSRHGSVIMGFTQFAPGPASSPEHSRAFD